MKSVAISSSVATADVLDFGRCCCCCSPMSLSEGANFLAPDGERTREKRRVPHFPPAQKNTGRDPRDSGRDEIWNNGHMFQLLAVVVWPFDAGFFFVVTAFGGMIPSFHGCQRLRLSQHPLRVEILKCFKMAAALYEPILENFGIVIK